MAKVNVLVLTGYGTNSHAESAHAALLAARIAPTSCIFPILWRVKPGLRTIICWYFPGGFLDGDDLEPPRPRRSAGCILADKAGVPLLDHLSRFLDDGKLMLGICNGFQLMVKLGFCPRWMESVLSARFHLPIMHRPAMRIAGCVLR